MLLEVLSIVAFIGGFAGHALVRLHRLASGVALDRRRRGASCSSLPSATVLYVGLVFKLIGFGDQLLMPQLSLGYRVETHAARCPVPDLGLRVRDVGRGRGRAVATESTAAAARRPASIISATMRRTSSPSSKRIATAIEAAADREELRAAHAARRRAQRGRLRAVGARGAARGRTAARQLAGIDEPQAARSPPSRSAPTSRKYGRRRAELRRRARDQGQADRRARTRRRAGRAIRAARPDVWLGVDANQGYVARTARPRWSRRWRSSASRFSSSRCRAAREADLDGYRSPIPIAADESALGLDDVAGLVGRFDVVNIKLDKCGGLTEALLIAEEARRLGLGVMVGNMVGTSLAMAPAFIAWPALRRRRPRRADFPREGSDARRRISGRHDLVPRRRLGIEARPA